MSRWRIVGAFVAVLLASHANAAELVPITGDLQVNTYTTDDQLWAVVGANSANGDFVVAWTSRYQDGDGDGVFAQRFHSDGSTNGTEFQVNTYTVNDQGNPAIGVDGNSGFVIVWDHGWSSETFAQRFDSTGAIVGTEFQVNSYTTGTQQSPRIAVSPAGDFVVVWISRYQDGDVNGIFGQRFDSNGSPSGTEFQINTYTVGYQDAAGVAAIEVTGGFVVTWSSVGQDGSAWGVFAQRFTSEGTTAGTEFQVNSATTGYQWSPAVSVASNGDFQITWSDGLHAIAAQRFSSVGTQIGTEYLVTTSVGEAELFGSSISIDPIGNALVVWDFSWLSDNSGDTFGQYFDSSGVPVAGEFVVNQDPVGPKKAASAASLGPGRFVVAWFDWYGPDGCRGTRRDVFAQRFASNGAPAGTEFSLNVQQDFDQSQPALAIDPNNGHLIVSWTDFPDRTRDNFGIRAGRWDSSGAAIGSEFEVNTFLTDYQTYSAIEVAADGSFVVAWQSDSDLAGQDGEASGIFAQRFASDGAAIGMEFQVNSYTSGNQNSPVIGMHPSGGDFVIAWSSYSYPATQDGDGYGIFAQRFSASAAPIGTEFMVNTSTAGNQGSPTVALGSTGEFFVAWDSPDEIMARRFGSDGSPIGNELMVNEYTTSYQSRPAITFDPSNGGFVAAWQSEYQDGSGGGIFGRRLNSLGAGFGSEFQVNSYTTGWQSDPVIAADPSTGDFAVAWVSDPQDGDGFGVFGQRFASDGNRIGTEFQVNSYTTHRQYQPVVDFDSSGNFVVAWSSSYQGGCGYSSGGGAFVRLFEEATPTGTLPPTATRTASRTATETRTVTSTPTTTETPTVTQTATSTPSSTDTATSTATATSTETATSTATATHTATETVTVTATATVTQTPTETATVTQTATPTPFALGDVSCDGPHSPIDAAALICLFVGNCNDGSFPVPCDTAAERARRADWDCSGGITTVDAQISLAVVVGTVLAGDTPLGMGNCP